MQGPEILTDMTAFALAVLLLLLTPGPTNTLLAMAGGTHGFVRSTPLIIAEISGYLLTITPVTLLATSLLAEHPHVGSAIKLASATWVLFLAVKLWTPPPVDADLGGAGDAVTFRRVFVTTVLNPKALIIGLVLMPAGGLAVALPYLALFSVTVVVVASCWLAAGATLIRSLRLRYPLAVTRFAASMLLVFSSMLAGSSLGLI